ncbi:MAG TPA: hypothetical protein VHV76_14605 [Mycobacteriales bacterium]|jgi:hypothetical protein|nr:hypothetical protein [Mycobacteriales bacterium]
MNVPRFVADFDSSTGLVRALAAALHQQPHQRLGRSRPAALAVRASRSVPERPRTAVFRRSGAAEGLAPDDIADVAPEEFGAWVADIYGPRKCDAVAVGSSNGAVMHLCAAMGVPWLPQTFLVPVRRSADPDDCKHDADLAGASSARLLDRQPGLQIHQMHDPNQDRLMVAKIAYFRMKLRSLTDSYRRYLRQTLVPGGTIIVVDCTASWPVTRRADRHVYQHGAVGGLTPEEYDNGSPRVARFLNEQGAATHRWEFPPTGGLAPEAEWGYEQAMSEDIQAFADADGYRVVHLRFPTPEAPSALVADIYRDWYASEGFPLSRLLAETFICVEPSWALATRTVPLWLTFGTEPSLATLSGYLHDHPDINELLVTLFPHGVRSAGYAAAQRWRDAGRTRDITTTLAGVRPAQWPADFASLVNYERALSRAAPRGPFPAPIRLDRVEAAIRHGGNAHNTQWISG